MNMKKKWKSILMAAGIAFFTALLPAGQVNAQETLKLPSDWALVDSQMAYYYDLIDDNDWGNFSENISKEALEKLCLNLYQSLKSQCDEDNIPEFTENISETDQINRRMVCVALYRALEASMPDVDFDAPVEHKALYKSQLSDAVYAMTYRGVLSSLDLKDLNLEDKASREMAYVLSARLYETAKKMTDEVSEGTFYKVTKGNKSMYILGTMHLLQAKSYPFQEDIYKAFDEAEKLVVELDLSDQEGLNYFTTRQFYQGEESLKNHLSESLYNELKEKIVSMNLDPEVYMKLKPWAMNLFLQTQLTESPATETIMGPDMYFVARNLGKKEVVELEGWEFQTDLFNDSDEKMQIDMLKDILETADEKSDESKEDMTKIQEAREDMLTAWENGEAYELEMMISSPKMEASSGEFEREFWDKRNINMAEKIEQYFEDESEDDYFVLFGAGHLYGSTGVIETLEAKGYKFKQIK
jgi:uncharacterized protein YbaP (TraB family)